MLDIARVSVHESYIDNIYGDGEIFLQEYADNAINSYFFLQSTVNPKHAAIARHYGSGVFRLLKTPKTGLTNVKPRDIQQAAFLDSLLDPSILVSVGVGSAGTGKTTLALAYAMHMYMTQNKVIQLTKPTTFIGDGNAFGPVPGDISEKYDPYLDSYYIVLKKILGDQALSYLHQMKTKDQLRFTPIALARGCTYENATFIIDEAQNLTWHELHSIISRIGEGSKCIILGDFTQIDTDQSTQETGFFQLINSAAFAHSEITGAIQLVSQYRSPITQLIAEVNDEIKSK